MAVSESIKEPRHLDLRGALIRKTRDETRLKLLFNRPRGVTDSILDSESSESGSNPRETFWGCRSADCEVMQVSAAREPRIEPGSKKACVTATAQLVP